MSRATVRSASGAALTQDFEEIFREHSKLVYSTAYSITGSRQDAEDVLQTIFVRLLQRDLPVEFHKNLKGYLYRAAVNVSLATIRSRSRQKIADGVEDLEDTAHGSVSSPDDEAKRRLTQAIAALNPRAVEILILRYEHDYSDTEIAKMLGKSRGTIAVTLYRARARLKKLLSATSGEKI
jgi:RNA polymerase sigma factor (sigma-70 family)